MLTLKVLDEAALDSSASENLQQSNDLETITDEPRTTDSLFPGTENTSNSEEQAKKAFQRYFTEAVKTSEEDSPHQETEDNIL